MINFYLIFDKVSNILPQNNRRTLYFLRQAAWPFITRRRIFPILHRSHVTSLGALIGWMHRGHVTSLGVVIGGQGLLVLSLVCAVGILDGLRGSGYELLLPPTGLSSVLSP